MFEGLSLHTTSLEVSGLLHYVCTILGFIASCALGAVAEVLGSSAGLFQVGQCTPQNCPGSFYLPITAAWANIGYMTHADFVHFVWNTKFGLWAALLYAVGAVGALISVAINQPPRTYMWFFLGPPIFAFLVGTTTNVQGVAWRIAQMNMDMEEVWRDAEAGMANTALKKRLGLTTDRKQGLSGTYDVAMPMVLLDGLFSEATRNLVSWIGMQRREEGGGDTNLFQKDTEQGPWQILANLKWGMVENIVGVNVKDPDVRDALSTFLTSECGDWFKKGVNTGAYSAASQSRGANIPKSVFIDAQDPSSSGEDDEPFRGPYSKFQHGLNVESIPTPRSVIRLFNAPRITGSFGEFSRGANNLNARRARESGRLTEIVCSEYLFVVIQAMRWEAGHAYWQLIRSFPSGFTGEEMALKTLFYGWNLRKGASGPLFTPEELKKYTKFLILGHLIRNELIVAPQVTETVQRFSPSEQMRGFTEGQIRQQGSRAKYGELYQWAVMMPHVQGVLAYLILIGYPFAAMLMVIPGYWKAFFTWVSFFAWVKLWDVGFAIVHALERSVWAMIGNHSAMARVGRRLAKTVDGSSDITVRCGSGAAGQKLAQTCSIPTVSENPGLDEDQAWFLLDQILAVSGSLDLDLSNGYYIYIMAALYFAVPAVTGQLVLGAKASLGGLATQAIGQNAQEAGGAAKAGTVGENATRMATNTASADQGLKFKSYRQSGFAQQSLDQQNAAMDADTRGAEIGGASRFASEVGNVRGMRAESQQGNQGQIQAGVTGFSNLGQEMTGAGKRDRDGNPADKPKLGATPRANGTAFRAGTAGGRRNFAGRGGAGAGAGGGAGEGYAGASDDSAGGEQSTGQATGSGSSAIGGGGSASGGPGAVGGGMLARGGSNAGLGMTGGGRSARRAARRASGGGSGASSSGAGLSSMGGGDYSSSGGTGSGSMGGGGSSGGAGAGSVGSFAGGALPQGTGMSPPGGAGGTGDFASSGYTVPGSGSAASLGKVGATLQKAMMATAGAIKNVDPRQALRMAGAGANTGMAIVGNRLRQDALRARAQGAGIGADLGWDKSAQDLYKGGHQAYGQRLSAYADFEAASAAFDGKNTSIASNAGMRAVMGEVAGNAAPGQKPGDLMGMAMSGQGGSDMRNAARYPGSSFFTNVGSAMSRGKRTMGGSALLSSRNWEQNTAGHDFGFAVAEGFRSIGNIPQFMSDAASGIDASNRGSGPGSSGRASSQEEQQLGEHLSNLGNLNFEEQQGGQPPPAQPQQQKP